MGCTHPHSKMTLPAKVQPLGARKLGSLKSRPVAAFANPSTGARGRGHLAGRSRGRRSGRCSPWCSRHWRLEAVPIGRPSAGSGEARRSSPSSKGAPALSEGWRMPRNAGSTDNRRQRSIRCYVKCWGWKSSVLLRWGIGFAAGRFKPRPSWFRRPLAAPEAFAALPIY